MLTRLIRLIRFLLPACVVAAGIVAAVGLFRDVSSKPAEPTSAQAPSLHLGPGAGPRVVLPSPGPTPTPSPTPTAVPETPPPPTSSPSRPLPARVTAPVVVFNASGVSGLAGRTAAALRLHGVDVTSIGNWSMSGQRAAVSAVYYAPGGQDQAVMLARLTGVTAVSPAPSGLAAAGTLVLVLTDTRATTVIEASAQTINVP